MTDDELKNLVASIAIAQQKNEERMKETDQRMKETDQRMKETDRQIKELGKQIGGLGEKFGSFTEGMAFPSMSKILTDKFGMEAIAPRYRIRKNGKTLELDVFAYSNGSDNKAVIVEVKSHLREEHLDQMMTILTQAKLFLPEHASKTFYGILAAVDAPESLKKRIQAMGIYYAEIQGSLFELQTPLDFQARPF